MAQANIEAALRSKADLKATNVEFEDLRNSMVLMSARIDANKEQQRNFEQTTNDRFENLTVTSEQSRLEQLHQEQTLNDYIYENNQLKSYTERLSTRADRFLHQLLVLERGWLQAGNTPVYFKELAEEHYPYEEITMVEHNGQLKGRLYQNKKSVFFSNRVIMRRGLCSKYVFRWKS